MLRVILVVGFIVIVGWALIKIAKLLPIEPKKPCSPLEDLDKKATEVATEKAAIKEQTDAAQEKINDINNKIK